MSRDRHAETRTVRDEWTLNAVSTARWTDEGTANRGGAHNEEPESEKETTERKRQRNRKREREKGRDVTCNVASLFTRIPFAIDPLCTKVEGVVRSPVPIALRIVYKTSAGCRAFRSSALLDVRLSSHPFALLLLSLSLSLSFCRAAATRCQTTREIVCITSPVCRTLAPTLPNLLSNLATADTRQRARNAMRSNRTLLVFCHGLEIHTIYM